MLVHAIDFISCLNKACLTSRVLINRFKSGTIRFRSRIWFVCCFGNLRRASEVEGFKKQACFA